MKKGTLILIGMFLLVFTVKANTESDFLTRTDANYTYQNSVNFIENGIEFYIFTNGDFDFNTYQTDRYYDYNGNRINYNDQLRIKRDFRGRISRIENIIIRYDYRGNVTRVGNILIDYYRDRLIRVGDLSVRYDRYGYPVFYGNVRDFYVHNGVRFSINFGDVCDYNDAYFFQNDFRINYNQFREDANFYYYRANPNAKIGKRSTILKRRKPASNIQRNVNITRNYNNSYRKSSDYRNENTKDEIRRNQNSNTIRNDDRSSFDSTRRVTSDKIDDIRNNMRKNLDSDAQRNIDSSRNASIISRNSNTHKRAETRKDLQGDRSQITENTTRIKIRDNGSKNEESTRKRRN